AFFDTRLSAHGVVYCWISLPPFAELLGLSGRGDIAARSLGRRLARPRPALALPPLGNVRLRPGAGKIAECGAMVPTLDLCRRRKTRSGREITLFCIPGPQERKRHGTGIRDIKALDRARQVEPRQKIAFFAGQAPQTFAFAAKHKGNRPMQRCLCKA